MTVSASDYATAVDRLRTALTHGYPLTAAHMKKILDVLLDYDTKLAALRTVWDAQIAILQAGGAGNISAEVDTAQTAVEAVLMEQPDIAANTVIDGQDGH